MGFPSLRPIGIGGLLAFCLGHAPVPCQEERLVRFEDSRISMACTYTIVIYGYESQPLARIVDAALDEIDRIDRLMSHYKPESPLSRLNREAARGPVTVEPELFDFLEECVKYSRRSEGAFDITVGPLMKVWGFFGGEGAVPSDTALSDARGKTGYRHLILNGNDRTLQFDRPGVELDLGGIAKGYAVDRAVRLLKDQGIERAFITAGGSTLYGMGAPPGSDDWEVKIRDPIDPQKIAFPVRLRNRALSVSGGSEKFFEVGGVRYSHIMDPRTGRPVQNVLAAAVLTASGTAGDALDNIFYVQSIEKSRALLRRFPGTEVFLFLPDASKGWKMIHLR
jgi:thiamine biosynthesis lipoprotein